MLSSEMEGQSDFNLEEICNKSQWSSGSRQERDQKYKTISKIQMLCLSDNIKTIVTSHISNYPGHREVSCPFDILIFNVGNNDDDDEKPG